MTHLSNSSISESLLSGWRCLAVPVLNYWLKTVAWVVDWVNGAFPTQAARRLISPVRVRVRTLGCQISGATGIRTPDPHTASVKTPVLQRATASTVYRI